MNCPKCKNKLNKNKSNDTSLFYIDKYWCNFCNEFWDNWIDKN